VPDVEPIPEMTLRDYVSVIWRRKWIVLLPIIVVGATAVALTAAATPQYRASADVLVRIPPTASSVGTSGVVMSPRMIENELESAQGSELVAVVREDVGSEPALSVGSSEESDVFRFTAVSSNADTAAAAANAYAERYIERQRTELVAEFGARASVIEDQLDLIEQGEGDPTRQDEYRSQLEDLRVSAELAQTSGARLIDRATPPSTPFEPTPIRTLMLALVVGALIGLGAAFLLDYLDRSIRDEDELQRISGVPNLASIPQVASTKKDGAPVVVSISDPGSAPAESYRNLRTAVRFLTLEQQLQMIQITSSHPGEGKTTTATNLAYAASKAGQRVLLIDCDLRKPQVHNFLGLSNYKGLTNVLLGEIEMGQVAQKLADSGGLLVITSGDVPPNPAELLAGNGIKRALAQIGSKFDLVVLDSPPVLAVSDPQILAELVDGVILVASGSSTDSRSVGRSIERLRQVDANVLGTVLNGTTATNTPVYEYGVVTPADPTPAKTKAPADTSS
jgi:capsular exopolysaccharide synthesis family protein